MKFGADSVDALDYLISGLIMLPKSISIGADEILPKRLQLTIYVGRHFLKALMHVTFNTLLKKKILSSVCVNLNIKSNLVWTD